VALVVPVLALGPEGVGGDLHGGREFRRPWVGLEVGDQVVHVLLVLPESIA
jgi:hypothetical protein